MVIGDGNNAIESTQQPGVFFRNEFPLMVIIQFVVSRLIGTIYIQYSQTVPNGDARSDNQEMIGKTGILRIFFLVDVMI